MPADPGGASPVLFTHQVAADATGISAGILKRQAKNGLLGWPSERLELGVPADRLTLHEVIRADAMRHFRAAGGRPTERTRAFLAQHRFDLRPFVLILRPEKTVTLIDADRVLEVVSEPGVFAVYDPAPLLTRLGLR